MVKYVMLCYAYGVKQFNEWDSCKILEMIMWTKRDIRFIYNYWEIKSII